MKWNKVKVCLNATNCINSKYTIRWRLIIRKWKTLVLPLTSIKGHKTPGSVHMDYHRHFLPKKLELVNSLLQTNKWWMQTNIHFQSLLLQHKRWAMEMRNRKIDFMKSCIGKCMALLTISQARKTSQIQLLLG